MNSASKIVTWQLIFSLWLPVATAEQEPLPAPPLSRDQQLIVAAFQLDVDGVKALLAEGAIANARMGEHPRELFQDKWSSGWPIASGRWTPLLAVANSHREPQPDILTKNTSQALEAADQKRRSIDPKLIAERDGRRISITKLLIAAKADLNLDDGYGETALASAVYEGYDNLALLLIEAGAKVNTKTGIYIDGTGDITPLHRATDRPQLVKALLQRSANVNARDSTGETALHWAVRAAQVESVRLLIDANADVNAKNNMGETPLSSVRIVDLPSLPQQNPEVVKLFRELGMDNGKMREISNPLRNAGAK